MSTEVDVKTLIIDEQEVSGLRGQTILEWRGKTTSNSHPLPYGG